ncbi:wax ester/triacylglycerol synthase family O-acyltransferase [Chloroflexota bacterium]
MITEPLSSIDRMWLRMEDPAHPMMITTLLVFGAPIGFEQLQTIFEHRLLQFSRFRQRVADAREGGGSTAWEDDPSFDLNHHLKQTSLPPPGDEAALRAVVGQLTSRQLDASKPLWQFHLIGPYDTGCALVGRVHHCLADGPALMHVLRALTDADPNAPRPTAPDQALPAPLEPARGTAAKLTELLAQQGFSILFTPFRLRSLARLGTGTMAVLNKLLWRTPDPTTSFKGRLGVSKRVAWSQPVTLADVKAVGRAVGGTVNDVMLAAATGALRRYLENHGEPVGGLTIRAGLSVNLRRLESGVALGNQAGALLIELPVGVDTALERLQQVKRRMDKLKNSPEASVIWALLNALGNAPAPMQDALVEAYLTRDTAVVANVPGPAATVYLAGAPLSSLMFWVPALGEAGLCLSIVSYAGQVWFGAATDQGLVPEPEQIMAGFHAEFKALQRATRALDQERDGAAVGEDPIEVMNAMLDEALAKVGALSKEKG